MDANRARRVTDALRDRGIDAHLEKGGVDIYGVRVVLSAGREAIWGNEGTASLEAEVLLDGDLVGFVPEIPGSGEFSDAEVADAIARRITRSPRGTRAPRRRRPGRPCRGKVACSAVSATVSATTPRRRAGPIHGLFTGGRAPVLEIG